MPSEYQTAVITCAAVLGIKTIVVALATVRARIMSSTFNFKNPEATNLFGALLDKSGLLLKFISAGGSKQMVDIFERISLNNATNEPIFVGLALAGGLAAALVPFQLGYAAYRTWRACRRTKADPQTPVQAV